MKKVHYILLLFSILSSSCSKDSTTSEQPVVDALDLVINLQEHPQEGISLGTIAGNNLENAVFKMVRQDPPNAFLVDQRTGLITVQDSTLFDYEINPTLTATFTVNNEVSSDEFTLEVILSDIDEVEFFLTDSKTTYQNATVGEWIFITAEEYEILAASLAEVTRIGTTQEEYNAEGPTQSSSEDFTFAMDNASIPEGAYVFAFKYDNASELSSGAKLKFTTDVWSGYADFGSLLPPHGSGESYFLLKGNAQSFETSGYLGFYNENSIRWIRTEGLDSRFYFGFGDNSRMEQSYENFIVRYQGLCTTIKQWN